MRETIIKSFDLLITVMAGLIVITSVIIGFMVMFQGAFFMGLAYMIGGCLYAVIFAGGLYLLIGIYENSKRTADAVERLSTR